MRKCVVGLVVVALSLGLFVGQAAAETATDTVDVYAGLAPVMELSCTDVNFGVWRVPAEARDGGATTIFLTETGATSIIDGSTGDIALSGHYKAPAAGSCSVTGSSAVNGTRGGTIMDSGTGDFVSSAGSGYESETIGVPSQGVESFSYNLGSSYPAALTDGATSFKLFGSMVIPDGLSTVHYGGYKGASITVTFIDENVNLTQ